MKWARTSPHVYETIYASPFGGRIERQYRASGTSRWVATGIEDLRIEGIPARRYILGTHKTLKDAKGAIEGYLARRAKELDAEAKLPSVERSEHQELGPR